MVRNKKIFLLIIGLLVSYFIYSLFQTDHNKVKISVKKNEIIIDNFEMAKVVDEKNNFYKINAKQAIIDRTAKVADLIDFTLVYKKGETDMTAKADAGTLIDEVKVDVNGKIVGTVNDLDFETSKNGTFHYDFDTEIGVLTGNVVVNNVEGTILADKAIIYHNQNSVEFNGNVKVIYTN